ncbi:hypothetical protein CMV30_05450 [Nibricoccus aquaticus]|uniref:FAD/FMN-containing dehydrogenase n=1 Tax=Nibricoccus aquaticus TaxID=2576891 RepID=A0A290QHW0_9BACT|nr:hypothetical protein [Nibricoccus aquaticus]ATC63442.1 hypothetical protein CMV30_05450 [Nibricoccus aquaticus]
MRAFFCSAFAFVSLILADVSSATEPYKVGDLFESFTTQDQHEKSYTLEPTVRTIVVSFTMGVGKDANRFFEKQPATFLADQQSIFLSNIYGMPSVGRFFALPKMKKYPHRILLADSEHFLDRYPKQEDMLTVFRLAPDSKITAIEFVDPEKNLPAVFPAPAK